MEARAASWRAAQAFAYLGHLTRPAGVVALVWPLLMMTRLTKNARRRILPLLLPLQPLRPHLAPAAVVAVVAAYLPACWARCVVAGCRAAWASPWQVCMWATRGL